MSAGGKILMCGFLITVGLAMFLGAMPSAIAGNVSAGWGVFFGAAAVVFGIVGFASLNAQP